MKISELKEQSDWDDDYGQSEYLNSLLRELNAGDAEGFEYYYLAVSEEISEASLIRAIANHINPESPKIKSHLIKLLLKIMKDGGDVGVVAGLIEAIRWHVDWPELHTIEKSLQSNSSLTETQYTDAQDSVYQMFQQSVERLGIWYVVNQMSKSKINFEKVPQLQQIFDDAKTEIVRDLLTNVKSGYAEFVSERIKKLRDIGVDWTELATIEKSLKAGIEEDWDDEDDIDDPERMAEMNIEEMQYGIDDNDVEHFAENYVAAEGHIGREEVVDQLAHYIAPASESKERLMKLLLGTIKYEIDHGFVASVGLFLAIKKNNVNWPELETIEKSLTHDLNEDKIKGADGKACWSGYRYAGTVKGKDKCIKVKKAQQ